jgi:hypothetical protein
MIQFKKKFYFFQLKESWFRLNDSVFQNLGLISYFCVQNPPSKIPKGLVINFSSTLSIDLNQDIEQIKSKFKSNLKNEINQAEKLPFEIIYNNDISTFIDFYNKFAGQKNIYQINEQLKNTIPKNRFLVGFSRLNEEILSANLYIYDIDLGIVRWFLGSSSRLNENVDKKTIGISNKFLLFQSLIHFKKLNLQKFDFGGFAENTTNKSLKGINDFKAAFGGELEKCISYHSLLYCILLKLSRKLDRRFLN